MPLRILGIDPGLVKTGWSILENFGNKTFYISSGTICPDTKISLGNRLSYLDNMLSQIIQDQSPNEAAIEEIFVNKNYKSTLYLGHARGVCLCTPARLGTPIYEYGANFIKKSITNYGHADKKQVFEMLKLFIELLPNKLKSDESDAVAVAYCRIIARSSALTQNYYNILK